jgi:hypothetical protein
MILNNAADANNPKHYRLLSDVHTSWADLFEGIVNADFTTPDMESPGDFGVPGQYPPVLYENQL